MIDNLKVKIVNDNFIAYHYLTCSFKEEIQKYINNVMSDYPIEAYETKVISFDLNKKERCFKAVLSHRRSAD